MNDPRETLNRIRQQADAATEGSWMGVCDSDGYLGRVIGPDGFGIAEDFRDDADAEFIAAARTTVPALLDLADAVLERHVKAQPITAAYGTQEGGDYCAACAEDWPCPDYTAATTALERATDARA